MQSLLERHSKKLILSLSAVLIGLSLAVFALVDQNGHPLDTSVAIQQTTVTPTEDTTSYLNNPMTGFQGDSFNQDWWEWKTGYLRAGAYCPSGTCSALNWDAINPAEGVYNFSSIDTYLEDLEARKSHLVFRVRNVVSKSDEPNIPAWAAAKGVTKSLGKESLGTDYAVEIDYHKCTFLDLWDDLVAELINRYDNDPRVVAVDIGSYGWYGEWFSGKTLTKRGLGWGVAPNDENDPTFQQSVDTRTRLIKMFTGGSGTGRCVDNNGQEQEISYSYTGFQNKPVLISRGDQDDVELGVNAGAGVRYDVVGKSASGHHNFDERVGPMIYGGSANGSSFESIWETRPILGEFSHSTMDSNYGKRSICYARRFHVTGIHDNFESFPVNEDLNQLMRELGYRLVLQMANYDSKFIPGVPAQMNFTWINKGTAPSYTDYPFYIYLKPDGQNTIASKIHLSNTKITQILPGSVTSIDDTFTVCPMSTPQEYTFNESFSVPTDLEEGTYDIYIGFEEPAYNNQIELAIQNKDTEGRYYLGEVLVTTDTSPSGTCGDGLVQTPNANGINEVCDDGNTSNGDQCSSDCLNECVPPQYWDGQSCQLDQSATCGDGILQSPNDDGINEQCDDGNTTSGDGCSEQCEIETYCGDGIVQQPNMLGLNEECDDGNSTNGDGCSATCSIESYCGDGIVQSPNDDGTNEQCDDGNNTNNDGCSSSCQLEETAEPQICGDDIVQNPNDDGISEECDDGNTISGDGCSSDCQIETYCGDGIVQSPNDDGLNEVCDDGNTTNKDGCSNICQIETYCGDGVVQQPNYYELEEFCDDGNKVSGDGCSANCQIEAPKAVGYCGDGSIQSPNSQGINEVCDDGNTRDSDQCSSDCLNSCPAPRVWTGSTCQIPLGSSEMTETCGDGIVQSPNSYRVDESCDDGNTVSGDGCSEFCQIETGDVNIDYSSDNTNQQNSPPSSESNEDNTSQTDTNDKEPEQNNPDTIDYEIPETCGNGTIEEGEECDDGNKVNNDSCTNSCTKPTTSNANDIQTTNPQTDPQNSSTSNSLISKEAFFGLIIATFVVSGLTIGVLISSKTQKKPGKISIPS